MGGTRTFQGRKTFPAAHEKALPTAGLAAGQLHRAAARAAAAATEPLLAGHARAWCGGWANIRGCTDACTDAWLRARGRGPESEEPQVLNMV